jgi:hypothetical protein
VEEQSKHISCSSKFPAAEFLKAVDSHLYDVKRFLMKELNLFLIPSSEIVRFRTTKFGEVEFRGISTSSSFYFGRIRHNIPVKRCLTTCVIKYYDVYTVDVCATSIISAINRLC